jgi:hypothetical protein
MQRLREPQKQHRLVAIFQEERLFQTPGIEVLIQGFFRHPEPERILGAHILGHLHRRPGQFIFIGHHLADQADLLGFRGPDIVPG